MPNFFFLPVSSDRRCLAIAPTNHRYLQMRVSRDPGDINPRDTYTSPLSPRSGQELPRSLSRASRDGIRLWIPGVQAYHPVQPIIIGLSL